MTVVEDVVCPVPGCDDPCYRLAPGSHCNKHRQRLRVHGSLELPPRPSTVERFMTKVAKVDGGCWVWTGSTFNTGYGQFKHDGEYLAHRWSYRHHVGSIPDGYVIDHRCFNRVCVNPAHLEAVTPKVNTHRSNIAHGSGVAVTECPRGHAYSPENTFVYPAASPRAGRRSCRECSRISNRRYLASGQRAAADRRRRDRLRGGGL